MTSYSAYSATIQATFLPSNCEKKLMAYICATAYPKCERIVSHSSSNNKKKAEEYIVSRPVCSSLCYDVVHECKETFESNGQQLPNCTSLPDKSSEVTLNDGSTTRVDCFTVDNSIDTPEFPFECTYPMASSPGAEPFPCSSLFLLSVHYVFLFIVH